MSEAHKCPQCGAYIIGTYCNKCKKDINEMSNSGWDSVPVELKDIFGGFCNE